MFMPHIIKADFEKEVDRREYIEIPEEPRGRPVEEPSREKVPAGPDRKPEREKEEVGA